MSDDIEAVTTADPPTVVEEGGPTSFAEALKRTYGEGDAPQEGSTDLSEDEIRAAFEGEPEKVEEEPEKVEEEPEKVEEAPKEPLPEFGFEGDDKEPEADPDFDVEAFDAETEKQVEGLDPKAQDGWKKLRQRVKEAEASARDASANQEKLAEMEKLTLQLDELKTRNEELQASDYAIKVQASPEFQQKIVGPRDEIQAMADQIAQEYEEDGVTKEEVLNAIRETSFKGRQERIAELKQKGVGDLIVSEIQRGHTLYRNARVEHDRMLANAETEWKEVEKKREADALAEAEKDAELVSRHLNDKWGKAAKIFGEDAIKDAQRRSSAIDIRRESPGNRAYAQMAGEAFPLALARIQALEAQLSEAGVVAKAVKATTPKLTDGKAPQDVSEPPTKKGSLVDHLNRHFPV